MRDLAMLGELGHFARDAVIEADATGKQHIGLVDRVIPVARTMDAKHIETERMIRRKRSEPMHSESHRNARLFGKLLEVRRCAAGDDAVARVDDGSLALPNEL